jgi:hypothetical protein
MLQTLADFFAADSSAKILKKPHLNHILLLLASLSSSMRGYSAAFPCRSVVRKGAWVTLQTSNFGGLPLQFRSQFDYATHGASCAPG